MMGKTKFYGVKAGRVVGVFMSWSDCSKSVNGYSGAEYKGFPTKGEAENYCNLSSKPSNTTTTTDTDSPSASERATRAAIPERTNGSATNFYAVRIGRTKGIFYSWEECSKSTAGFPGAQFKKFNNLEQASEFTTSCESYYEPPAPLVHIEDPVMQQEIRLAKMQRIAVQRILLGESLFISGSGGVGKSFVIQLVRDFLRTCKDFECCRRVMAFTASTGCAALGIQGETIHSWAGVGLGLDSELTAHQLVEDLSKVAKKRWKRTNCLLIEEISMITAGALNKLSQLGSIIRKNSAPFGGMQVIFCGDFCQLPPVKDNTFCFSCEAWKSLFPAGSKNIVNLDKILRQKDKLFCSMLEELRWGKVTECSHRAMQNKYMDYVHKSNTAARLTTSSLWWYEKRETRAVKLFSKKVDVQQENDYNLSRRNGETYSYEAIDSSVDFSHRLSKDTQALLTLDLKRGVKVMLVMNQDVKRGLVNGSVGVVVDFEERVNDKDGTACTLPIVRFPLSQLKDPLAELESKALEAGLNCPLNEQCKGYRLLQKLFGYEQGSGLGKRRQGMVEPLKVIQSQCSLGFGDKCETKEFIEKTIDVENFTLRDAYQEVIACRKQIPLILAYAITIHKAQGMSIADLEVDLKGIFAPGQAYVALSRAISLDGLALKNYVPQAFKTHPAAAEFYAANLPSDGNVDCAICTKSDMACNDCFVSTSFAELLSFCEENNVCGSRKVDVAD